ncbi:MAG: type II secretion system F family protein [Patescibacteria group bacterium]
MPIFSYTAKNLYGKTVTGTVDARSQEIALGLLKNQNLVVIDLGEKKEDIFEKFLDFRGVPQGEVVTFTRQLSTMISAGLPIARALDVLANQATNKNFKKIILEILRSVEGGVSLSMALGMHSKVFSTTYISLVRAGESSGKLDTILKRLADNMEAERDLNSKFKSAMIYPAIVFIAMIGVFIVLMVFVIPKLSEMYTNMDVELPATTQFMISASNFMVRYLYIVFSLAVVLVLGIRSFVQSSKGKVFISEIVIKIPIFGKITLQKDYAKFSRTLSLLINSAVPIVEALNIVSTVMTSQTLKNAVLDASYQVEKGNSLSNYFKSTSKFPSILGQMAGVGEETGKMDEVLERVAIYYEGEVDNLVKGLSSALEPVILVMLGVMVGFLIISIITPIYKLTSAI